MMRSNLMSMNVLLFFVVRGEFIRYACRDYRMIVGNFENSAMWL